MIFTLSGVTGVGKSYYKNLLIQELGLQNMVIYTTRKKRVGEIDGIDKHFITPAQMQQKKQDGTIFAVYSMLGENYGYGSSYLKQGYNSVTEFHYEWILDLKEKVKDICAIYLVPTNIERAQEELRKRNLPEEVYQARLNEMQEQNKIMQQDETMRNAFDIILENDYTKVSEARIISTVKRMIE